jgi:hypothetical protein
MLDDPSASAMRPHPLAELIDQPGVLGNRDELGRGHEASFRMAPAQQPRFAAGDPVIQNADALPNLTE